MNRAFSVVEIKSVNADLRTITGIATTPATDRQDDVVESRGAVFKLPIPLLWQHQHDKPIGEVTRARVTDAGIEIEAKIADITEPGTLKDRIDEAWHAVKAGLVRGLSIGFKSLTQEPIHGTYGTRFTKWLWLELSAVTVPANEQASILTVKRYAAEAKGGRTVLRQPWADVDDEIASAKARAALLEREHKDAEYKLDDVRWRVTADAMRGVSQKLEGLQVKRAQMMAGTYIEPAVVVPPKPAQQPRAASKEYLAAEAAALQKIGLSEKHAGLPFTLGEHAIFFTEIVDVIKALQARVSAIEETGIKPCGAYQRALAYQRGSIVSYSGSAWVALKEVEAGVAPSTDNAWQLLVKAGRDGRDGKDR